jgi:hypothetical protein
VSEAANAVQALEPASSSSMLVVLLGASEFPFKPAWSNPVLGASARAFRDYALSDTGMSIPRQRLLDLFDDSDDPAKQCLRVQEFLSREGATASDLILYYVGHGTFDNDEYCLGVRSTQQDREYLTTIESRKLAKSVRNGFPRKRIYLILDSCFAASAAQDWQGEEATLAVRKLAKAMPGHGTAFLAAASKDDVTKAPRSERYTVFTGALLQVLTKGVPTAPSPFSLHDLYEEVLAVVQQRPDAGLSCPEIHVPRQQDGDISRLPLFRNAASHSPVNQATPSSIEEHEKLLGPSVPSLRQADHSDGMGARILGAIASLEKAAAEQSSPIPPTKDKSDEISEFVYGLIGWVVVALIAVVMTYAVHKCRS